MIFFSQGMLFQCSIKYIMQLYSYQNCSDRYKSFPFHSVYFISITLSQYHQYQIFLSLLYLYKAIEHCQYIVLFELENYL